MREIFNRKYSQGNSNNSRQSKAELVQTPLHLIPRTPVLVNMPTEPKRPEISLFTEFYIIPKSGVTAIDGKHAFNMRYWENIRKEYIRDGNHYGMTDFSNNSYERWEFYTNGKETFRLNGEKLPMFSTSDGKFTFWPRFYKWLLDNKLVLVRVPPGEEVILEWEPIYK